MEHPVIREIERLGYPDEQYKDVDVIDQCKNCDNYIREGETVIEFYDFLFCDEDCLTEAFCQSPRIFGAEKIRA